MKTLFEKYDSIVFLDTETTGLDFEKDQIIELAAILCVATDTGIKIVKEMDDLIRLPEGELLPPEIVKLTHITDEMLHTEGVSLNESAKKFSEFLQNGKTLVCAYNAQFDLNYLFYFLHRENLSCCLKGVEMLDALTVYKDRHEYPHKLENAIEVYNLGDQVVNSHRAIDDTKALLKVMLAMGKEEKDLARYINLFGYNPKYGVSGKKIGTVTYAPQPYRHTKKLYES